MRIGKKERQRIIKSIIKKKEISSHHQLLNELRKNGIKTNQPTVSRDLRELRVIKASKGFGKVVYQIPEIIKKMSLSDFRYKLAHLVEEVKHTGNLILIKVPPGEAPAVAKAIDDADLDMVLGTVAGDDTILVVAQDKIGVKKILRMIGQNQKTT
jgi:transcriptional regulator of arginine metabolism